MCRFVNAAIGSAGILPPAHKWLCRELIRIRSDRALSMLSAFVSAAPERLLEINSRALSLAAELWAAARQQGRPTAKSESLDIDVILAAQVLAAGFSSGQYIVATSNLKHLVPVVVAGLWQNI